MNEILDPCRRLVAHAVMVTAERGPQRLQAEADSQRRTTRTHICSARSASPNANSTSARESSTRGLFGDIYHRTGSERRGVGK